MIETEKQTELENLKADVEKTLNLYESYISGSANRTRQMIENKGIKKIHLNNECFFIFYMSTILQYKNKKKFVGFLQCVFYQNCVIQVCFIFL